MPKLPCVVIGLLLLLHSGCGGGSAAGAGNATADLFQGTYRYIYMTKSGIPDGVAVTGTATPQSGLLVEANSYLVTNGSVSGPTSGSTIDFDITSDRRFTLSGGQIRGRMTADGMLAAATSTTLATDSFLFVYVRHDAAPVLSELAGEWASISFGRSAVPGYMSVSSFQDATLDAAGVLTVANLITNFDGDINPLPQVALPAQLLVNANGEIAVNSGGDIVQRGGVSEDGNLILLAGHMASGVPAVRVLIRKGQATATDLLGNYDYGALQFLLGAPTASFGSLDRPASPGDAAVQSSLLGVGGIIGPHSFGFSPGVLADGVLTLVRTDFGNIYRGALARNGDYAFCGAAISPGTAPQFFVLVR